MSEVAERENSRYSISLRSEKYGYEGSTDVRVEGSAVRVALSLINFRGLADCAALFSPDQAKEFATDLLSAAEKAEEE